MERGIAADDFAAGMDGELMRSTGSIRRSTLKLAGLCVCNIEE